MVYKNSLRFSQNLIFPHFFCVIEQNSVWVVISSFFFFPVRIIMYQKFYYYFLIKWQNENLLILTLTSLGFCMCLEYFDFFFSSDGGEKTHFCFVIRITQIATS